MDRQDTAAIAGGFGLLLGAVALVVGALSTSWTNAIGLLACVFVAFIMAWLGVFLIATGVGNERQRRKVDRG